MNILFVRNSMFWWPWCYCRICAAWIPKFPYSFSDVSFRPAFVGFLRKLIASSKFNCLSDNIAISITFISWMYDFSCVESMLFCFLVFCVILVSVSFWVPAFSGVVNTWLVLMVVLKVYLLRLMRAKLLVFHLVKIFIFVSENKHDRFLFP